jgi:hypothetical protein
MRRYLQNDEISPIPSYVKNTRIFPTVRLPKIPIKFEDYYAYTTRGDRYDTLAQTFYGDSSYWWIIATCNPTNSSDSLIPEIGTQIRIPNKSRISEILILYSKININSSNTTNNI